MPEPTKIDFHHRRISRLSDFTELVEMLFPGSRNQRYAASCIFFELKWARGIVPNLKYIEAKYHITRRVFQRARAKLARIGLIEQVSRLNSRYDGQQGWRLSSRFETGLRQLAGRCATFREQSMSSKEKEHLFLQLTNSSRERPRTDREG